MQYMPACLPAGPWFRSTGIPFFMILALGNILGMVGAEESAYAAQEARLRQDQPGVRIAIDTRLGVADHIVLPPGAPRQAKAVAVAGNDAATVAAQEFLDRYPGLLGGDRTLLQDAVVVRDGGRQGDAIREVVWQQTIEGIPVYGGRLRAVCNRAGDLLTIGSGCVPTTAIAARRQDLTARAKDRPLDAHGALAAALASWGDALPEAARVVAPPAGLQARQELTSVATTRTVTAHLVWFPRQAQDLRLAWNLLLTRRQDGKMYEVVVEAGTGDLLTSRCLTVSDPLVPRGKDGAVQRPVAPALAPAPAAAPVPPAGVKESAPRASVVPQAVNLRVFTEESPTPLRYGWSGPTGPTPATVARTLVSITSLDATASPEGWVDPTLGDTRGNNVDAHTDLDADDLADLPRPKGTGSPLTFDFPCDLSQPPSAYRNAAVVNLFYWCNVAHDRLYQVGFTEDFGNFQVNNFGRGGVGGDAVFADAQDGSGTDNANFSTPPDGTPGYMQMYVCTFSTPERDTDLDAMIILHEYGHGLSTRLVGGGGGMDTLQAGGLGEGWSDFVALSLLTQPGETVAGNYSAGGYAFDAGYFGGIRRHPYAYEAGAVTGSSVNPLTFVDIRTNNEEHDMGEVWCQTLWDARALVILQVGNTTTGNDHMLRLVVAGMKLTPANPTFLQARDALLQADQALYGGTYTNALWQAFAKRGMGVDAFTANSTSTADVVESFTLPGDLRVSDGTTVITGPPGGSFATEGGTYVLRNVSTHAVSWSAAGTTTWLQASPASGTLAVGGQVTVTVTPTADANLLPRGQSLAEVVFTNTTDGSGTSRRNVILGASRNYEVVELAGEWIDPSAHAGIVLTDDSVSSTQSLPFPVTFYGLSYSNLWISSNGLLGFLGSSDLAQYQNSTIPSRVKPDGLICAMWDDLVPSASSASVRFGVSGTAPNRSIVVSWINVPVYQRGGLWQARYTMQVVLPETGKTIRVNYLSVGTGLTSGLGISGTVGVESDLGVIGRQFSANTASLRDGMSLAYTWPADNPVAPVVVTPVAIGTAPVLPLKARTLTVLGYDDGGEASLTYSWSVVNPAQAASVHFTRSGTNAAKSTGVTFDTGGQYTVRCTITDAVGLTAQSDLVVDVLIPQTITGFSPLAPMTYGDAPRSITGVTGGGSGNAVVFISLDPTVATVSGTTITVVGAGNARIRAQQAAGAGYAVATEVQQTLAVARRPATLQAADGVRAYGAANPTFTGTAEGLLPADGVLVYYLSSALPSTPRGTYGPTTAQAIVPLLADPLGRLSNYQVTATNGTLEIIDAGSVPGGGSGGGGGGGGGSGCGAGAGIALLGLGGLLLVRRRRR